MPSGMYEGEGIYGGWQRGSGCGSWVGVDPLKDIVFNRLQSGRSIRFSASLEPPYFE